MKVYINADIEGIAGNSHWNEASKNHVGYAEFREPMFWGFWALVRALYPG